MKARLCRIMIAFAVAFVLAAAAGADDQEYGVHPPPRAARSVHLHYPAPEAVLFYNEVTVAESPPGTYFCACGFSHGYFGIQELANGDHVVLFSVWDPGNQN